MLMVSVNLVTPSLMESSRTGKTWRGYGRTSTQMSCVHYQKRSVFPPCDVLRILTISFRSIPFC